MLKKDYNLEEFSVIQKNRFKVKIHGFDNSHQDLTYKVSNFNYYHGEWQDVRLHFHSLSSEKSGSIFSYLLSIKEYLEKNIKITVEITFIDKIGQPICVFLLDCKDVDIWWEDFDLNNSNGDMLDMFLALKKPNIYSKKDD